MTRWISAPGTCRVIDPGPDHTKAKAACDEAEAAFLKA